MEINLFKQRLKEIGISDWLEDWDIKNISQEVNKLQPGQKYVEIGVAFGVSASLALLSSPMGVHVFGVDILDQPTRDDNIRTILSMYNQPERFNNWTFVHGESEISGRYWDMDEIDVLFIDGGHTYEGCLRDIALWIPRVKHGGVIMFDDYHERTGVKQAINEVLRNHTAFKDHVVEGEMYKCTKI